jgi:hypothetical protein
MMKAAEGEAVSSSSSSSSSSVGKDPGERWQEDDDDNDGRRGGRVFVVDVSSSLALARLRSHLLSTPSPR